MNDDKIKKILADKQKLVNKLSDLTAGHIPLKHTSRPATYKAYLLNEIRLVEVKLEQLKGI